MTILHTANYNLPYCDAQTALADLADVTQEMAEAIDEQLGLFGYTPPDATTFAALAARTTTAEGKVAVLEGKVAPTYVTPTFLNSFAQFTTAPYGEKVRANKTALGEVTLRGHLSVPVRGNTNSVVMLNLPAGYRPAVQLTRYMFLNGNTAAAPTVWRVDIETGGDVRALPAATTASVGFAVLDFTFRTAEPA